MENILSNKSNSTRADWNNDKTSNFILVSIGNLDKQLSFKVFQLVLVYVTIGILLCFFGRIIYVTRAHRFLRNTGNIAITTFLLSDILIILYRVVIVSLVLIAEEIAVSKANAMIGTFVYQYFLAINGYCLMILSLEKLMYTKYVYLHIRIFKSIRRLLYYYLGGLIGLIIPTILLLIYNDNLYYKKGFYVLAAITNTQPYNSVSLLFILNIAFISTTVFCHFYIFLYAVKMSSPKVQPIPANAKNMDKFYIKGILHKALSSAVAVMFLIASTIVDRFSKAHVTSEDVQRSLTLIGIVLRILNPVILVFGNKPLREQVLLKGANTVPDWLQAIQQDNLKRKTTQHNETICEERTESYNTNVVVISGDHISFSYT